MQLFKGLTSRLIILFVLVFVSITLMFLWFMGNSSRSYEQQATQALHEELAAHMLIEAQILKNGEIDPKALKYTFHNMMLLGPAFEIYVTDTKGNLLAHAAEEEKIKRKKISLAPIKAFISPEVQFPLLGDDPRHPNRQKIFSAAPINYEGRHQGYLYVIIGSELEDKIIANLTNNRLLNESLILGGSALLFALFVGTILIWLITRPLSRMTCNVLMYQEEQRWHRNQQLNLVENSTSWLSSNEEVALARVIDNMSEKIARQLEQLKIKDIQRKELLSYISHDLRTPLSSLTGYIETWQKQFGDSAEESSAHYIDVAQRNAKVLSGLVEQVFELAHLETGSVELHREPIAVAELAQDIMDSFDLRAQQAGVELDVSPKDTSLQVDADIAKLERVFGNLVANAIRHTPPGGRIVIRFDLVNFDNQEKVHITVQDSGVGISKDQLPRVFEAHFRASNKTDSESGNAGLGLAIVKALLALHHSDIEVESEEEQGTSFSFYLPRYRIT
ncbi:MAG: sensor histidine kinase [Psychrobium sp.]